MPRILLVDDEPAVRRAVKRILSPLKADILEAEDGVDAIEQLGQTSFDLILTDLKMPRADGVAVVRAVREKQPRASVIVLTASGSMADCVKVMRAGASNFVSKPFSPVELEQIVREGLQAAQPPPETPRGPKAPSRNSQVALVGKSERLRAVLGLLERVAYADATVLIGGESGTGKEVAARLIHSTSARAGRPFVTVNCGAIPEGLVESELFGHARGSFTGATEKRIGKFALADGGSIFLDEVGELPLGAQVKLLRVLQEREITPVGESKAQRIDVRVVAATNRDLEAMVKAGGFREDLFFRLNVLPVEMPPLRERREDVELLAKYFLELANGRAGRRTYLAPRTLELMQRHSWPGNVRELENLIERVVVISQGDEIGPELLPARMRKGTGPPKEPAPPPASSPSPSPSPSSPPPSPLPDSGINLERTLDDAEWKLIEQALQKTGGNKARAAALLGMKRTTLVEKLKRRR